MTQRRQNKLARNLLNLALTGAVGLLAACGGQDTATPNATVTSSTALAVATQSVVLNDESVAIDRTASVPLCLNPDSDPDGDGWGWENQTTCAAPVTGTTRAQSTPNDDLPIGILYFLWHCNATAKNGQYNITRILDGQQSWGNNGAFHWWDKPDAGYYCLGERPDIIAQHLTLLRDAGVDYLVLDITNHPNTASFEAETFILKSFRPLLEIARTIPGAPKMVPWVPLAADNPGTINQRNTACNANRSSNLCIQYQQAQPMYQHLTDVLLNEYPDLTFKYQGKPLLLEAANDIRYARHETDLVRPQLQTNWTVKRTWGLSLTNDEWQFLSTCSNPSDFYQSKGWSAEGCNQPVNAGEQISVSAAYQYTYISEPFEKNQNSHAGYTGGMPKFYGRTFAQQFRVAFENRDSQPMVILTGWNEWIAQRFDFEGRSTFVDLYDNNLNRDIEPGGRSGDLYYHLMRDLINQYRNNKPFAFEDYFLTSKSILDTNFYWNNNADLQSVYSKDDVQGIQNHWLTTGIAEGRRPSAVFDVNHYRNSHPHLANAGLLDNEQLLKHFLDAGFQEGLRGSADFHAKNYLSERRDIAALYGDNGYYKAFKHYVSTAL